MSEWILANLDGIVTLSPVVSLLVVVWWLERRDRIAAQDHDRNTQKLLRNVLREACDLPAEAALNGDAD